MAEAREARPRHQPHVSGPYDPDVKPSSQNNLSYSITFGLQTLEILGDHPRMVYLHDHERGIAAVTL